MPILTDPLIVEAFQIAAQPKSSLRTVQTHLAEHGAVSRSGEPLSLARIHAFLHDESYAEPTADRSPLVSKYLFGKVQKRLRQRRR